MKTRLQLCPKHLKHFRLKRNLTLKQAAECLRKSERQPIPSLTNMYERIERTGITSPATASAIAKMLHASVDQLKGEIDKGDLPGLWWCESYASRDGGCVEVGWIALIEQFRRQGREVADWFKGRPADLIADVRITPSDCRVAIREAHTDPRREDAVEPQSWWCVRPATRNVSGIVWQEFTAVEADEIRWLATDVAFSLADIVEVDGFRHPPASARTVFELRVIEANGELDASQRVSQKQYAELDSLADALLLRFRANESHRFHLSHDDHSVTVVELSDTALLQIGRVALDTDAGESVRAPWRRDDILGLRKLLHRLLGIQFPHSTFFAFDLTSKVFVPLDEAFQQDPP